MSPIVLPGDIPGLLRRGSPVALIAPFPTLEGTDGAYAAWTAERGGPPGCRRAVVLAVDGVRVQLAAGAVVMWALPDDVALNLTDATGRAHAAWWLARALGDTGPTSATWLFMSGRPAVEHRDINGAYIDLDDGKEAGWLLSTGREWLADREWLAVLDPEDPRLLPDGSRWVDAEALRLVVLHVAGRAP